MLRIEDFANREQNICVVGLGYVGLPLAVLFNCKFAVTGFDINHERIEELKKGFDRTREITKDGLLESSIVFTDDASLIAEASVVVVTVPTPIDEHKTPDLRPMRSATTTVGKNMKKGSVVIFESTVYPGLTEEECIPILEKESGLKWKKDFHVGYSPERVNPGDKEHTIDKIKKVVSGDSPEITEFIAQLYGNVITAGVHKAPNIKTAEAAKVIENTQRDLNIALMNELSVIFNKMGIDTKDVLDAASTKWNFLRFEPGLVGGHCIGVDPYYLTFKAESLGYHPQVILAGRRINDNMGKFVAEHTVKKIIEAGKPVKGSKVLMLGFTFKENISDIRNTKLINVVHELREYGISVHVYDPFAYEDEVRSEYGIDLIKTMDAFRPYDAIVLGVKHKPFLENLDFAKLKALSNGTPPVLIDIKSFYDRNKAEDAGFLYWRL
ncbi:MAG: nucleotide sugar dehydrogenase [Nitrospirae bacterium]|nr:MAG: nucleotide sugar dehydrogenase [Nitrospirota bacterium]